ncbi:hypothetical protein G5714_004057 [Onychostoma macrolepis]|uniref:Uncharacterized protein n=1 Tax=Onychostoma macrolepis TaxID=369639 RepID=A0A7J6DB55_9TELE|nr:hypothetical protein G5714_004057 [Onychostoma macrolepis]
MRTLTSSHAPQRHIVTHTQSAMSREPELSQPEPQFQLPFSQGFVLPQATMFANASVQTPTSQLSPLAEQFVPNSPAVHLSQPSHAQSVPQHEQSPACFQALQSSHATPATAAAVDTLENWSLVSSLEVEGSSVCGDADNLSNLEQESSLARTSTWVLSDPDRAAEASAAEEASITELEHESHEDMASPPGVTLSDPDPVQSN